ncbi:MAG: SPFH domain-containing protein [Tractidigestivibacter sp.]|jgi:membrane protease subunit (stomatin/prohibitin family)|uniref:SPFH domain-containing protein n=1 Tax=Tractidigestivibacter sp. TaxID=2847320 RepID=UPI003D8D40E0
MGIFDATFDSIGEALSDQWRDVITAGSFSEHKLVAPGVRKNSKNGYGNNRGTKDIITNGSVIYVPEHTAAFIFSQSGIEKVITTPGGHTYNNGEATVFDALDQGIRGVGRSLLEQAAERVTFSGMPAESKHVAFVNLRELRGIRFGTHGPLAYNDRYYGADLEVYAYGMISVQVSDPEFVIRNFVPANCPSYSLDDPRARRQLTGEFLTSFVASVNALSSEFRVSQLPSQTTAICKKIREEKDNAGTWPERYGLKLVSVAIEDIEFSDQSRELVRQFSEKRMGVRAYEDISQQAAKHLRTADDCPRRARQRSGRGRQHALWDEPRERPQPAKRLRDQQQHGSGRGGNLQDRFNRRPGGEPQEAQGIPRCWAPPKGARASPLSDAPSVA